MSSRFGSSLSVDSQRIRRAFNRQGTARPFMTDREIEAYLMARETLRQFRRASSIRTEQPRR